MVIMVNQVVIMDKIWYWILLLTWVWDPIRYNLLLIIFDRCRKQAISYFMLVVLIIMIKKGNKMGGSRMMLIEMVVIMEFKIVKWF